MEVWPVNTVQFSNHPGYGHRTGQVFTGAQVTDVVDGIAARGVLGQCAAVLSGYLGDAGGRRSGAGRGGPGPRSQPGARCIVATR